MSLIGFFVAMKDLDQTYTDTWHTRAESLAGSGFKTYEEYLQSDLWKSIKDRASRRKESHYLYHKAVAGTRIPSGVSSKIKFEERKFRT